MSENPRKRQLENELTIIGNEDTYEEDNDDEHDDEEENHQEESQNDCKNNTDEDINVDDDFKVTGINEGDDDDDDSINSDPWGICDEDDEDDDYDDCQLQRAIKEDHPINSILEFIKLFPMQAKHENEFGEYPLHTACLSNIKGHDIVVMKLIELYPEAVQYKNSSGLYPLHLAFHSDKSDAVVMKLIEIFPKPIRKSSKNGNALHHFCKTYNGSAPHFATYYLSETLLRKLIEINPKAIQEQDCRGRYPIYYAINCNQSVAVIKILLDGDPLGMKRIAEYDTNYGTIPHLACDNYNVDLVKYLMQRSDFQINVRDNRGRTPLHNACSYRFCRNENSRNQIVDMILNHPDVDVNATNNLNDTPLHTTLKCYDRYCRNDNHEGFPSNSNPEGLHSIIQKLLDHEGILINKKNNHNKTPLDLIQDIVHMWEKNENELTTCLSCFMKIIHLLKEFALKRRWQGYCYYVKNFVNS